MIDILALNIAAFLFMFGVNFTYGIYTAYLDHLGATSFIISLSAMALYLSRGTSSFLTNKLSQRISYKNLFLIAFIGSAISTYILTIPTNPSVVSLLRILQGIFSGTYWVLINIYAFSLGSNIYNKFKNLSIVSILLNIGGFLGSILSGKLATEYSVNVCFYISMSILAFGSISCLFLKDIKSKEEKPKEKSKPKLNSKERLVTSFAIFSSLINAYISISIPIYILQLGGSYNEVGVTSGIGILAAVMINIFAPYLRKNFCYRSIMTTDYLCIISSLFLMYYYKNILVIYFLQAILTGAGTLERNLWFSVLQEHSSNYNKAIGVLRGFNDYVGAAFFLVFGYLIQKIGSANVATIMCVFAYFMLNVILYYKKLHFLRYNKSIRINRIAKYDHIIYRM